MKKLLFFTIALLATVVSSFAQLRIYTVTGTNSLGYNSGGGVAEITAYDPITKNLFVINGNANLIQVYNFSNPSIFPLPTVTSLVVPNSGSINSIACYKGLLAIVYENVTDRTQNGFLQLYTTTGLVAIGSPIAVGAQPDMVTFTPNGQKVLVANEGEPNVWYTVDPAGSVTVVDVSNPASPSTTQISLSPLNGTVPHLSTQPTTMPSIRIFGMINSVEASVAGFATTNVKTPSTVEQDLEPEYITVSADGNTAWVSCQENNAMLVINLTNNTITTLVGLGYKDHSIAGNGIDASRTPANSASISITGWPYKGMYQPDGIATWSIGGVNYVFSANEGDARHWPDGGSFDGQGFNEEFDLNTAGTAARLNGANFTTTQIFNITTAGTRATNTMGNLNGGNPFLQSSLTGIPANINAGNDYEELYTFGTRSFSIWNGQTGQLVWDSGDTFEQITAAQFPNNFNADHNGGAISNNPRRRSNTKGPEPEAIVIGKIGDSLFAFIGLERIGGVMVFNVTNPNAPYFRQYINTRNFAVNPNSAAAVDLGPEGLTFVKPQDSPNGLAYLVVSNEVSGTIRVFGFEPFVMPMVTFNGFTLPIADGMVDLNNKIWSNSMGTRSFNVVGSAASLSGNNLVPIMPGYVTVTGTIASILGFNAYSKDIIVNILGMPKSTPISSYIKTTIPGAFFKPILTAGEDVSGYKMTGIPDGVGAFDNNDGTFTMLVNHEIPATSGGVRAHGNTGAFVSKWVIKKSDFSVISGSDLIQNVRLWNGSGFTTYNAMNNSTLAALGRFCSADLPAPSAFWNQATGKGTMERIFMNGEEIGNEGRAFGHIVTG
ncbi:MAG: choice-of-anchor I family protein, partial [Bacteroidota bacterium]|nr:choice-of-anchor I family protein [Bacteroidota bacterium]